MCGNVRKGRVACLGLSLSVAWSRQTGVLFSLRFYSILFYLVCSMAIRAIREVSCRLDGVDSTALGEMGELCM